METDWSTLGRGPNVSPLQAGPANLVAKEASPPNKPASLIDPPANAGVWHHDRRAGRIHSA
ncbi:hypothetical protein BN2475_630053 [Paraburkholderia ribeironis]|uniref:Uncharacterized protein n=1 Tax=Paraburkholderia ribeironis TaxID=1247936 RepID=A0A1N7SFS2_9BURK|nr:hypothetical protein BN2475_630053 [Paraburkholderia ribeironis]